ncbi:sugar kinase [Cupriavidus sp. 30B13]|uniref:sugar kinase n=1 Tax=Cupriavidus sp. 30B13 TaxID=3384241 RepID=UPI003B90B9F8
MSAAAIDVVTLGESMALFVAGEAGALRDVEHFTRRLAGAETNVAIGLARLGLKVAWVSRLGTDSFGDFVLDSVAREGVDCAQVTRDATRPTGFMLKSRAAAGADPAVEYFRRGSAASALSLRDFDAARFAAARHLHVTGISPALSGSAAELVEHSMRFMREAGRGISFDPNLRPGLWPGRAAMAGHINRLAALADWVMPGLAEGRLLTGRDDPADIAAFYLERGAQAVIVKLGADGAYYRTAGEQGTVPGVPVARIVDTVGAGDGFAAGVLSARLEGLGWPAALARGNWIGARALQSIGDMDGLPRRSELPH